MNKLLTFLRSWICCKKQKNYDPLPEGFREGTTFIKVVSMNELQQLFEIMIEYGIDADYRFIEHTIRMRSSPERPICIGKSFNDYDWAYVDQIRRTKVVQFRYVLQRHRSICDMSEIMNILDD